MQFRWIDWNRDHLAAHGVDPREGEMVVRQARAPFHEQIRDDKILVMGQGIGGRFAGHLSVGRRRHGVHNPRTTTDCSREDSISPKEEKMNRKKNKPYWEMTTAELREATKEFD